MPGIEETIAFIQKAHAGQRDAGGRDYYLHPIAVMNRLPEEADLEIKLAALLHDVLEDTPLTRADLHALGYSDRTLDVVELLTQRPDDRRPYAEKVAALIASGNRDALQVKFADMTQNMDLAGLALLEPERRAHYIAKYTAPLEALRYALSQGGAAA